VDISDEPLADAEIGPQLAVGRDNTIFAVGTDRVLRRAPDRRSFLAEARAMEQMAAHGYPVPRVHRVSPGEMVLERVPGPTMLDDLSRRPWRLGAHARLLADLHHRLHRIPAPEDLRVAPVPGSVVVHLDLHPQNVILSPSGPVVIDWTNVARGAGPADVAMTWIIIAVSEVDDPGLLGPVLTLFRRRFVERFLAHAGRGEARAVLRSVATYRAEDRNVRPGELVQLEQLVRNEDV
jgi:aminoglycoside phosphotransferase (APT) family kinase protein